VGILMVAQCCEGEPGPVSFLVQIIAINGVKILVTSIIVACTNPLEHISSKSLSTHYVGQDQDPNVWAR
jgi:hypothetical protein